MTSCDFQPNVFLQSPHLLVFSPWGTLSESFKGSSYSRSIRAWDLVASTSRPQARVREVIWKVGEVLGLGESLCP